MFADILFRIFAGTIPAILSDIFFRHCVMDWVGHSIWHTVLQARHSVRVPETLTVWQTLFRARGGEVWAGRFVGLAVAIRPVGTQRAGKQLTSSLKGSGP